MKSDDLDLTIEKLVFGGDGLAHHEGKVYFVPGALPGEKVLVRVMNDKKNYGKTKRLKILANSPARVDPPCPYYGQCGGCQYQHIRYPEELRWKEYQVREGFERHFRPDAKRVEPIRFGPGDYHYRNSVTLHRTSGQTGTAQRLGFFGVDNTSVLGVENCLLANQRLEAVFKSRYLMKKGEDDRTFKCAEDGEIVSSQEAKLYRTRVGKESLWASSAGFFQNHAAVTELVADRLLDWVVEARPKCFVDLYAGVGTFSILSAWDVPDVCGVEENPNSMECLRKNFLERNIKPAGMIEGRVENVFPAFSKTLPSEGIFVFMDPPRSGIDRSLSLFLAESDGIGHLAYLSCDLAILLRDLKLILSKGKYVIRQVVPFDMFPRTKHIEVMVLLVNLKNG